MSKQTPEYLLSCLEKKLDDLQTDHKRLTNLLISLRFEIAGLKEQNTELTTALEKQIMYLDNILDPETRPVPIYRTLITEAKKRAEIALAKHQKVQK